MERKIMRSFKLLFIIVAVVALYQVIGGGAYDPTKDYEALRSSSELKSGTGGLY